MRHRITCPLYDEHPKHLEVIDHLNRFSRNDRGRELSTLAVAGFAALYGQGRSAHPQSLDLDFAELLRNMLAVQTGSSSHVTDQNVEPSPSQNKPKIKPIPEDEKKAETKNLGRPTQSLPAKNASLPLPKKVGSPVGDDNDLVDEDPAISNYDHDDDDDADALSVIGSRFGL